MIVFCVLVRTCACCCEVVGSRGRSMGKGVERSKRSWLAEGPCFQEK